MTAEVTEAEVEEARKVFIDKLIAYGGEHPAGGFAIVFETARAFAKMLFIIEKQTGINLADVLKRPVSVEKL